jgi:hypothetical protein
MSRHENSFANLEQATVDPEFSKVVAPPYWCDELARIDVSSIARLQRMMCNHGMEVVGDTSTPLHHVMGVHRSKDEPTLMFNNDIPSEKRWKRRVILDPEDEAWENQFKTVPVQIVTPEAGVDSGLGVNFSHTPPELAVFAELPQAKAISAAGRLASRQLDVSIDPAPYIDQFERWFGFPNKFISNVMHKTTVPISVPRLLAAGGKSASPIYGIENYSGIVRFIEPSATRLSFVTKDDDRLHNEVAVDFSYYRAAIRWVMATALQVPGGAKEQIEHYKGVIGFDIALRGRVVVPEKAMEFNIPTLSFEAKAAPTYIIKETRKAIENAMSGRTAVIAGLILEESDYLLSCATRERMGKIRDGKSYKRSQEQDVKTPQYSAAIWHAQAGVGLKDYCINMLGANEEHLSRNPTLLGRLSGLLEQKALNHSRQHCLWVSMLWDASFKNSFQRMCQNNSTSLDDFVAQSPDDYPYDAKISYMVMKSRIGSVITRIKALESLFTSGLSYNKSHAPLVSDYRKVITAWAGFYAGKSKTTDKGWRRIRAQVLSTYYAQVRIEGDSLAFPDLKVFLEEVIYNYARRKKLEQIDYEAIPNVETLAAVADGEYNPDYKFSALLKSLEKMSTWTLADMVAKKDNMVAEDEIAEQVDNAPQVEEEDMEALLLFEQNMLSNELQGGDEYLINNMKGPLAMRAKFYAVCEMTGSERDFIRTKMNRPYASFEEWATVEPDFYDENLEILCNAYQAASEVAAEGDADDADIV